MPIAIRIRINVNHTKSHPANIILRLRKKKNVRISIIIDAWRGLNQSPFGIIIKKIDTVYDPSCSNYEVRLNIMITRGYAERQLFPSPYFFPPLKIPPVVNFLFLTMVRNRKERSIFLD